MKLPGLTTTRVHLLMALMCAMTQSVGGWIAVALIVAVIVARVWTRHHIAVEEGTATTFVGTGVPSIAPLTPGGRAA